jgi:ABC-type branched-subunit amino acid transport system substrate-binding protein
VIIRPAAGCTGHAGAGGGAAAARLLASATAAAVALAGCGGGSSSPAVPAGPGVTATTITLGVLTDLSGPAAAMGKAVTQGTQLFWQDQDRRGGVCGHDVHLLVKDHGGSARVAAGLYGGLRGSVLALQQVLGADVLTAVQGRIAHDGVLTMPVSWSSKLLTVPSLVIAGTTEDVEMIDGVAWLTATKGLRPGDRIGHIYVDDGDGRDALLGTTAAARAGGLTLVPERILPTDRDLSAQVQAIRATGARGILLSTSPSQAASAASVAQAEGYDVTFVGANAAFIPSVLEGPARAAIEQRLVVVQPFAPFSGDGQAATTVRDEYDAAFADEPPSVVNAGADYGYGQGEVMYRILGAACAAGSLQRPALLRALGGLRSVDTGGLLAPLDLSTPGQPPARQVYVLQPDATSQGGLRVLLPLAAAPLATAYRCPC